MLIRKHSFSFLGLQVAQLLYLSCLILSYSWNSTEYPFFPPDRIFQNVAQFIQNSDLVIPLSAFKQQHVVITCLWIPIFTPTHNTVNSYFWTYTLDLLYINKPTTSLSWIFLWSPEQVIFILMNYILLLPLSFTYKHFMFLVLGLLSQLGPEFPFLN